MMSPQANTWLESTLLTCDSNLLANLGELKTWDGQTALHLFREIMDTYGRHWTRHDSPEQLKAAYQASLRQPQAMLWDSSFIRRLCLSALGDRDTGFYRTGAN